VEEITTDDATVPRAVEAVALEEELFETGSGQPWGLIGNCHSQFGSSAIAPATTLPVTRVAIAEV
jgi:hypothetical protein